MSTSSLIISLLLGRGFSREGSGCEGKLLQLELHLMVLQCLPLGDASVELWRQMASCAALPAYSLLLQLWVACTVSSSLSRISCDIGLTSCPIFLPTPIYTFRLNYAVFKECPSISVLFIHLCVLIIFTVLLGGTNFLCE